MKSKQKTNVTTISMKTTLKMPDMIDVLYNYGDITFRVDEDDDRAVCPGRSVGLIAHGSNNFADLGVGSNDEMAVADLYR